MNLYWFSDEEGKYWRVVSARDEQRAWEVLARESYPDHLHSVHRGIPVEEAKKWFELDAVTQINNTEGEVAFISANNATFLIKKAFGDTELGHLRKF